MNKALIVPPPLRSDNDIIAICSPAGAVRTDLFDPAAEALRQCGFAVKVMPNARGRSGTYSAPVDMRISDMKEALTDPQVKAILCGRGGYGAVQILEYIAPYVSADCPKWLIGFSDITALHALWHAKGIASLHASMLKGIVEENFADTLASCLRGQIPPMSFPPHPLNRAGSVTAPIVGGNLSVMAQLIGTPYSLLDDARSHILFIEDINEPIYKLQRILYQLRLSGILPGLAGLIVGQFTGTNPDANYPDAYSMIADMIAPYDYPVAFGASIGHFPGNRPILLAAATLTCSIDTDSKIFLNTA